MKVPAALAKLADAPDLGSGSERNGGSNPSRRSDFHKINESRPDAPATKHSEIRPTARAMLCGRVMPRSLADQQLI